MQRVPSFLYKILRVHFLLLSIQKYSRHLVHKNQNKEIIFNRVHDKANNYLKVKYFLKRFRMDFQKYINHNTNRSVNKLQTSKKLTLSKPRVIKFVGNMKDNIKQLLHGINCHCGDKKEFYNILVVFANKIEKLRTERDHYKNTLKQYLLTMNAGPKTAKNHSVFETKNLNQLRQTQKLLNITKLQSVPSTVISSTNNQNRNPFDKPSKPYHKDDFKTLYTEESLPNQKYIKQFKPKQQQSRPKMFQSQHTKKNSFTAIKKPQNDHFVPSKYNKTQDKKMSYFYQTEKKASDCVPAELSFSLNFSSFQEIEHKDKKTNEFMKEFSSIMNETNLLDSDDQLQSANSDNKRNGQKSKLPQKGSEAQQKISKLKMLKQSTNLQQILISLNDQDIHLQNKQWNSGQKKSQGKNQNPEQGSKSQGKSTKKQDKHENKENLKGQSWIKKNNKICSDKLDELIDNNQRLKQLQKSRDLDINLRNYKSISSCILKKDLLRDYKSQKQSIKYKKPLQQRKFEFNV